MRCFLVWSHRIFESPSSVHCTMCDMLGIRMPHLRRAVLRDTVWERRVMTEQLDWKKIDKWLMGEAFVGSRLDEHLFEICERIGPRWAGTAGDDAAGEYIERQFREMGMSNPRREPFDLNAWDYSVCEGRVLDDDMPISLVPMIHCPPIDIRARIANAGFGMPHEIEPRRDDLAGSIAVIDAGDEPFSLPIPMPERLRALAAAGCVAAVAVEPRAGGHIETVRATDKRWNAQAGDVLPHPLPTVQTHREDGVRLKRAHGKTLSLRVESRAFTAPCSNTIAEIPGGAWPNESLVLGAHQDTYMGSPGAVDDGSGVVVLLEIARLLVDARRELGVQPGMSVRFCTWSGEEQNHQGSAAYVRQHYGREPHPRLVVNLDELAAGPIKGIVLQFPHLRGLVQRALDELGQGLQCHVMPMLDHMNDGFSFARSAIPTAIIWRWRFVGRHPDSNFRAEPWDTVDKVRVRELEEYVGFLSRTILRLSRVPPSDWPPNPETVDGVESRLRREIGAVQRTM